MINFAAKTLSHIFTALELVAAVIAIIAMVLLANFFSVWLRARVAGINIGWLELIAMRVRGTPCALIIDAKIAMLKAGLDATLVQLEAHHLAGGKVVHVVQALIAAKESGIPLDWQRACVIDLMSRRSHIDVLDVISSALKPENEGRNIDEIVCEILAEHGQGNYDFPRFS